MKKKSTSLPTQHWEKKYSSTVKKDSSNTMGSEFSPKKSSDRMTTYIKVNKEDH